MLRGYRTVSAFACRGAVGPWYAGAAIVKSTRTAARWGSATMWVVLCVVLTGGGFSTPALGQTPAQKAQAQVLFDEGRELIDGGKTAEACDKFAASYRLDPTMGTQLNLAVCYEKLGRIASAWILFIEIQTTARRAGQIKRADFARQRALELAPKLSKLKVHVTERVPELAITVDGEPLSDGAWESFVPVDPGERTVVATAPGSKEWSKTVTVGAEADKVSVTIPALAAAPVTVEPPTDGNAPPPPKPDPGPDEGESDGHVQTALGWTAAALGVGAVGAGVALRMVALSTDEESKEHCLPDDPLQCTQEGKDLRDEAQGLELGSVIAWAGGGALLVTGIVLLFTAPSGEETEETAGPIEWQVIGGLDRAALQVRLRW